MLLITIRLFSDITISTLVLFQQSGWLGFSQYSLIGNNNDYCTILTRDDFF